MSDTSESVIRSSKERAYTPDLLLHVLRNPHGWGVEAIRAARLEGADEIERLRKENRELRAVVTIEAKHNCELANELESRSGETRVQFKVGDYVQVGPDECGTFGTIVHIGTERAGVQYDHGPKRDPLLTVLKHARAPAPKTYTSSSDQECLNCNHWPHEHLCPAPKGKP